MDIGLLCAAAPGIKPLIQKIAPGFLSSNHSKPASSAWATRTARSHNTRHFEGTFELTSQEDLRQPEDNAITNKFWSGSDGEASGSAVPGKDIVKTVSTMVTTDYKNPSVDGKEDSVERFEHV